MNLWVIFITGLTVGGLTCLAVQGGLLASIIAVKEEDDLEKGDKKKHTLLPTLSFLSAKLVAYTLLGFLLGAFGGAIGISPTVQVVMQFLVGLYMIAIALNLLNAHPIFRYAVIQPPRFLTKHIRKQSKNKDLFAPALLGAMTIFIPCGTTLAMEALAISSGNAFLGALIMLVFVLGTTPLFFGVGWITTVLGDNYQRGFLKVAAIAVLYLGISAMNGALVAGGSPITLQKIYENSPLYVATNTQQDITLRSKSSNVKIENGIQVIDISVAADGYSPTVLNVKKDMPVRLNLKASNAYSCASAFRIPSLGIAKNLQPNGQDSVEFTPVKSGEIAFTCSMGMYRGVIQVI